MSVKYSGDVLQLAGDGSDVVNAAVYGGNVRQYGSDGHDALGADVRSARVVQDGGDDTDYIFACLLFFVFIFSFL